MAKVVNDGDNRFRAAWTRVKEGGHGRAMMSDSLGIDRGRLNDLILGRAKPTLGEQSALVDARHSSYVVWADESGKAHSQYTGRGKSAEYMFSHLDEIEDMMDMIALERDYPVGTNDIVSMGPSANPRGRRIFSTRSWR